MFESIIKFFKKVGNKEEKTPNSKEAAKERLHLVLMQDRANVSADFLELMKQEIIEVIKKYIEVDESAIDVRLTNKENEDGTNGAPALYANIPIINIKNEARKLEKNKQEENEKEVKDEIKKEENDKKDKVEEENEKEVETNKEKEQVQNEENKELKENEEQEEKVEKIEEEKEDLTQKVQIKEDSQENNEKDNEKSTINNNYNKNNKKKNKKSNKK